MTKEELLRHTEVFLLDLDGTVYLDDTPIGEMSHTLARLREGRRLVFLTNNSSKTAKEYEAKLRRIGLFSEEDGVYTSSMAMAEYLRRNFGEKRVFLLATDAVKEEFEEGGILLSDTDPDVCVLAYDTTLTFEKLRRFDFFLRQGLPFLATHPDDVCPTKDGSMPDVGAFLALFERSSHRRSDFIVGKPNTAMGELLAEKYGVPLSNFAMVGDRMHTDIRFANSCGMAAVLVLSGETTRESMKAFPDRPDLVLPDLNLLFRRA